MDATIVISGDKAEKTATGYRVTAKIRCDLPSGHIALSKVVGVGVTPAQALSHLVEASANAMRGSFTMAAMEIWADTPEPRTAAPAKAKAKVKAK
jgi:hypothetical protein